MYTQLAVVALASVAAAQASTPAAAGSGAAAATPVPTQITPSQSSAIAAGFASYNSYLENAPYVASLGQALNTWLPVASWDNWNNQGFYSDLSKSTDYIAVATATPTYSYPSWMTFLPGSLQSEWGAFVTSVTVAHQSIVRNALGLTSGPLPAPTAGVQEGYTPTANMISVNTNQPNAAVMATGAPVAVGAVAGLAAILGMAL